MAYSVTLKAVKLDMNKYRIGFQSIVCNQTLRILIGGTQYWLQLTDQEFENLGGHEAMDVGEVFPLSGTPIAELMRKEKGVKMGSKCQGFKINLFHEPGQLYPRRTALGQETSFFPQLLPRRTPLVTPLSKKVRFEEPSDKDEVKPMPRIITILDEKHGNNFEACGAGHRWEAGGPLGHKWSKVDNEGTESQFAMVGKRCLDFFWSTVDKVRRPEKDQGWREHRAPARAKSGASRSQNDAESDAQSDTQSNAESNAQSNAQSNARPKRVSERCPERRPERRPERERRPSRAMPRASSRARR